MLKGRFRYHPCVLVLMLAICILNAYRSFGINFQVFVGSSIILLLFIIAILSIGIIIGKKAELITVELIVKLLDSVDM